MAPPPFLPRLSFQQGVIRAVQIKRISARAHRSTTLPVRRFSKRVEFEGAGRAIPGAEVMPKAGLDPNKRRLKRNEQRQASFPPSAEVAKAGSMYSFVGRFRGDAARCRRTPIGSPG